MDLFYLDRTVLNFFINFNSYDLFMVSIAGMLGTYLICGTYYNNKKGSKKK